MISDIFQEIRARTEYVGEVQRQVHEVLVAFQQDAQNRGIQIIVAAGIPDATGATLELSERTPGKSSTVNVEINSAGDMLIWREHTTNHKPEIHDSERRQIDLSKSSVSTAVDVLLAIADDHRGFVGSTLENFLRNSAIGEASNVPDPPQLQ